MSPSDLRISVVIPNLNSGPLLERAIRSILDQTYRNYELLVADSLSTDESAAVIERFRSRIDVLIREKDTGQADALNRGFARASGDIFCWLCADDELLPWAFATVAARFAAHPATDMVVGRCERVYENGEREVTVPPPDVLDRIGYVDLIEQPSCFWRASLHRNCGPLDEGFHLVFDWDLWCRMRIAGARIHIADQVFSRYYFSASNKMSTSALTFVEEASAVLRRYGPLGGRLASVWNLLFRCFDLKGCYDHPPSCGRLRLWAFYAFHRALRLLIGDNLVNSYNWQFASRQARGLKWW